MIEPLGIFALGFVVGFALMLIAIVICNHIFK